MMRNEAMITVKNLRLNNDKNQPYLIFNDEIAFEDNTIYFVIGKSGIGKTSLIDFFSSPFTDDPIKNGKIIISPDIAPKSLSGKKAAMSVTNSTGFYALEYTEFVRKSIAYIPQKTDSFHPFIPVRKQLESYFQQALLPKRNFMDRIVERLQSLQKSAESKDMFNELLQELSSCAGWDSVCANASDNKTLILNDKKVYIDRDGREFPIIGRFNKEDMFATDENIRKVFERELSSGQRQRLLILLGLLQFHVSDNPILLGDEFLVNFTYCEANDVLKNIITFFMREKKKHKTAIFILHDLSFDFIKELPKDLPENYSVRVIAIEKDETYQTGKNDASDIQKITARDMSLFDFFNNSELRDPFRSFRKSYDITALPQDECAIVPKFSDGVIFDVDIRQSNLPEDDHTQEPVCIYKNIHFKIRKNRFIVLTGFSGCGKSTLCNQILEYCVKDKDKKTFRYVPSLLLSSLSEDSQASIYQDLSIMYRYYHDVDDMVNEDGFLDASNEALRENLKAVLRDVHFYDTDVTDETLDAFLAKKIYDLSGGEQQRYWLARILFPFRLREQPALLALDESIASLDCLTKNKIIALLLQKVLFSKRGMSILLVSHDLRDIGVIYETLVQSVGQERIDAVFEHYEMFNGTLYKVSTPFSEYRENLIAHKENRYRSLSGDEELSLKLKTAQFDAAKRQQKRHKASIKKGKKK
ncbi:MAG: ATP-binding cassette domain-containing protein [Treponema sp.]|jgi:ABC-type glutathione transport system ATPase component|nr:ATP-binding cassette domain-containing protein [Treponema sp.]